MAKAGFIMGIIGLSIQAFIILIGILLGAAVLTAII